MKMSKILVYISPILYIVLYNSHSLVGNEDLKWRLFFIGISLIMLIQEFKINLLTLYSSGIEKAISFFLLVSFLIIFVKELGNFNYNYDHWLDWVLGFIVGIFIYLLVISNKVKWPKDSQK